MYTYANNNMAADEQHKAFHGIKEGKWLRNLVVHISAATSQVLHWICLPYIDRYLPQLPAMIFWINSPKKLFFFLFKKSNRFQQIVVHNERVYSRLPILNMLSRLLYPLKVEEKIFLNLFCIQMDSFIKEERATCIPQHCVSGNKHQQNNNMKESKADFITVECLHFLITWIYTLQIL